jgi:hypothetical protein
MEKIARALGLKPSQLFKVMEEELADSQDHEAVATHRR